MTRHSHYFATSVLVFKSIAVASPNPTPRFFFSSGQHSTIRIWLFFYCTKVLSYSICELLGTLPFSHSPMRKPACHERAGLFWLAASEALIEATEYLGGEGGRWASFFSEGGWHTGNSSEEGKAAAREPAPGGIEVLCLLFEDMLVKGSVAEKSQERSSRTWTVDMWREMGGWSQPKGCTQSWIQGVDGGRTINESNGTRQWGVRGRFLMWRGIEGELTVVCES